MNVSPGLTSGSAEVISFELLVSASRPGLPAISWCKSNRLTLASKARHAELRAGVDKADFVGVAALAALKEKRITGALPAGSVLLLDSVPSLPYFRGTELILQLVELAAGDVTIVTLGDFPRAWGKDLSADLSMFMLTISELHRLQQRRELHSLRIKVGLKFRRERTAQETGEVAQ